jgi:hypothetical protein
MIAVDRHEVGDGSVIRIRLNNEVDRSRLVSVFMRLADGEVRTLDLAEQDGFSCADMKAFVLGIVSKMRLETVSISNEQVSWTKTKEGWLEACDLVNGLTRHSHQILGDGDATVEVELGAE